MAALKQNTGTQKNEFETLLGAHERCVNNIMQRSFLQVRGVRCAIDDVLRTCQELCSATKKYGDDDGDAVQRLSEQRIIELDRCFARQVHWLLLQLNERDLGRRVRADALLLRLNYNDYWKSSIQTFADDARKKI
jgi:hypothetical protein